MFTQHKLALFNSGINANNQPDHHRVLLPSFIAGSSFVVKGGSPLLPIFYGVVLVNVAPCCVFMLEPKLSHVRASDV
jgi:hypothetical protein